MKVVFWRSEKPRERLISNAFGEGVRAHGDTYEIRRTEDYLDPTDDTDVALCMGLKGQSSDIFKHHLMAGMDVVFIDKGYTRQRGAHGIDRYHRFSVNEFQPLSYFRRIKRSPERWEKTGIRFVDAEWEMGGPVIFAGSSEKYSRWHHLPHPTEYAEKTIFRISKALKTLARRNPIIYRPKPSWRNAVPIDGTRFSGHGERIGDLLTDRPLALVTHGSNASFDSLIHGIPTIVLGPALVAPIVRTDILKGLARPRVASQAKRLAWCHAMAWCQWEIPEMQSGECWQDLKMIIEWQRKRSDRPRHTAAVEG